MFKKLIFATIVFIGVFASKSVFANQIVCETITPNKLTIEWSDGRSGKVTIDTFRMRGYNVAQLRTLVQACGGSIINATKTQGYQIVTQRQNVPFTPIGFSGVTTVRVQFNVTEIMDKSGRYITPGAPGWVLLTDYNYNWGSIRDVLVAMGYEIKSFRDDPARAQTSVVIGNITNTHQGAKEFPTPVDFIRTNPNVMNPLYIYLEDFMKPSITHPGYRFTNVIDPNLTGTKIWIHARDGMKEIRLHNVDYRKVGDDFGFVATKHFYSGMLTAEEIVVLDTIVPGGIPTTAVTFYNWLSDVQSYLLDYDGRTGHIKATKTTLHGI